MSPWIAISVGNSSGRVEIKNTDLSEQEIWKLQTVFVRQGSHLSPEIPLFNACTVFPLWNVKYLNLSLRHLKQLNHKNQQNKTGRGREGE